MRAWLTSRALLLAVLLGVGLGSAPAQELAAIPKLDSPVVDTTGTLDAAAKQQLEQQALALQQRKGSQIQILIIPSTQPEAIEQYTQRVFDQWKLGRKGVDDGVLLLVAKDDRRVRIQPGYGLEGAIPDAIANRVIQEYLVPKFRTGDFAGGITDATGVLVKLVDGEALPAPVSDHRAAREGSGGGGGGWLFALFAAFIAANIARAVFSRAPSGVRGLLTGGAAGGVAWLFSSLWMLGGIAGVFGLLYGLLTIATPGRYARHRDWGGWGGGGFGGGGGWGGGGGGGFGGGGGWGGGGGMSGGGGAAGSW